MDEKNISVQFFFYGKKLYKAKDLVDIDSIFSIVVQFLLHSFIFELDTSRTITKPFFFFFFFLVFLSNYLCSAISILVNKK
jgi:hypothetical protein